MIFYLISGYYLIMGFQVQPTKAFNVCPTFVYVSCFCRLQFLLIPPTQTAFSLHLIAAVLMNS
jgi:hypothetical protein